MCLICMKYRIIFLIIIIISLGQILLSYIANTSRRHARTDARTHTRAHAPARTHPTSPYRYSMGLCQPTVTARSAGDNSWSLAIEIESEFHLFEPHIQKKYLNMISGYKMWIGRPLLRPVWSLSQGPPKL